MSLAQVGRALKVNRQTVYAWETGRNKPTEAQAAQCDELYGTTHLRWLVRHARRAHGTDWRRDRAELESRAEEVWQFALSWLPGLLQTRAYAMACVECGLSPHRAEAMADIRIGRQEQITRSHDPVHFWSVIDQAALTRPIGGPAVMVEQLDHLIGMAALPNVSVRVLATEDGEHIGLDGPLRLFRLSDSRQKVAYAEATLEGRLLWGEDAEVIERVYEKISTKALNDRGSMALIKEIRDGMAKVAT